MQGECSSSWRGHCARGRSEPTWPRLALPDRGTSPARTAHPSSVPLVIVPLAARQVAPYTGRVTSQPVSPTGLPARPERSLRFWLAALGVFTLCSILRFAYFFLDDLTRQHPGTFGRRLLEESTGGLTAFVCFIGVVWLHDHLPLSRAALRQRLPVYLGAFSAYTVVHTSLMWGSRTVLSPLLGLGPYDYGRFPTRFFMEAGEDAISFSAFVIALSLVDSYRARREGERRERDLERHFVRAQLERLRLQLQPHFLFNALNTISQVMYEDPAAADEMMGHLAELLREAIRTTHRQEVTLGEELTLLEHYIAIMHARFGDDLRIRLEATSEVRDALVPSLLLQPLVENAVRHGNASRYGRGQVDVTARRIDDRLEVAVLNDGDAEPEVGQGTGVGLNATAERLALLYGDGCDFHAGATGGGGFRVSIRIPFRAGTPEPGPRAPATRALPKLPHARTAG
jgi:two-component system, LytTR family, sensor kinase